MNTQDRELKRAKYLRLVGLVNYFQKLANEARDEIWADEPSEFWRGVHNSAEEVSTWPQWKIDSCQNILKPSCQPVDYSKGEWRCNCRPDPEFDTSINPKYVSKCNKCGSMRPGNIQGNSK
jgi:hypothetical protein